MSLIHSGIRTAAFRNTVDDLYSVAISQHFQDKDLDKEALRLIRRWIELNELSYYERYPNEPHDFTFKMWQWSIHQPLTAVQLYKFLQCLDYNIEGKDTDPDVILLKSWIDDLKIAIINTTPEYQAAEWC